MAGRLALLALVAATAACGAEFTAALHVTIDGPALSTGGGYWIEMRKPDGAAIDGLSREFIAYADGSQDVAVVLKSDRLFDGNDSRTVRLIVDAVAQRDAPLMARGAVLVEIDRDEAAELTVELTDDPRPVASPISVAYDGASAAANVDPASLSSDAGLVFDLWVDGGEPIWVQRLSAGSPFALDLAAHRAMILENGLRLVVTAEPGDSPEPLVRSSGWPVLRGAMPGPLVETLITAPYAETGVLASMLSILDTVEAHRGFALTAHGNNNQSGVRSHSEHVFSGIAGEAVAEADPGSGPEGDLNEDGIVDFVVTDRTGVGPGTLEAPGYLRRLNGALSELETQLVDGDALTCATSLGTAVSAALDAARQFAELPLDGTRATTFDTAVLRVRGAAYDELSVGNPDQTTLCIIGELEPLADFELAPVAAGTD